MTQSLSRAEARRIALAAQGFGLRRTEAPSGWAAMRRAFEAMGVLQIDSVNVLTRSHYLPVFSRIGAYPRHRLDRASLAPKGRAMVEYWAHEASFLPVEDQPLWRWRMARARTGEGIYAGLSRFAREKRAYIDAVLEEVARHGPLTARALERPGARKGPWWGWSDGKTALEYLFWTGRVTAAGRRNFERVYDIPDRALPRSVLDAPTPGEDEAIRALVSKAARALGVASETDLRDYFRLPVAACRAAIAALAEDGILRPVQVEGWARPGYLARGAAAPRRIAPSALLSPFDPLVWHRDRAERLFDFHYRLELYTPATKRRFGYYVLPFLMRGRLAGRVDLKADRAAGRLLVLGAFAEPGEKPEAVAEALAPELARMAAWLELDDIRVAANGNLAVPLAGIIRRARD